MTAYHFEVAVYNGNGNTPVVFHSSLKKVPKLRWWNLAIARRSMKTLTGTRTGP